MFYVRRLQTKGVRGNVMMLADNIVTSACTEPPPGKKELMSAKLIAQYKDNAKGVVVDHDKESFDLMKQGVRWVLVSDDANTPCVMAKYQKSPAGDIDLSEVIKHPQHVGDGVAALFKFAYFYERDTDRSLTLTAATKKLVEIYSTFGFVERFGRTPPQASVMSSATSDGFTQVNLPMIMQSPSAEVLGAQFRVIPS